MNIIIQTPDFKATKKLERFAQSHVMKLAAINGLINEAHVCLKMDNSDTNENKICEITLAIPGNDLFAMKQTETFEKSVIKTISALKHQMEHLKTVREKRKHM